MTRLINRYIAQQIGMMIAIALLVLAGLDGLFTLIAEFDALEHSYHAREAMIYVLATMPSRIYQWIPIATLMGCLLALGNLASSSELIVMRAAGISVLGIVRKALYPVIGVVIVGLLLGQYLTPMTEHFSQNYRAIKLGGGTLLRVKYGNWQRQGDEFIHMNAIEPNGIIHGITRYRFVDHQLKEMSFAERAIYQNQQWVMQKQQQSILSETSVRVHDAPQAIWQSQLTPEILELAVLKPEHLSITGLYRYAHYMQQQGLRYLPYLLAFWKKISQPFATLAMVLVAAAFVFGPLRSGTMGLRIMVGLMAGLFFNYLQEFLGFASLAFNIQPWIASVVPILVFSTMGVVLIRRVK